MKSICCPWFTLLCLLLASWSPAASAAGTPDGRVRRYFIGADEIQWNYAPGGNRLADLFCGADGDVWIKRGSEGAPPVFKKAVFREYTDASFTRLQGRSPEWAHLGLLGPVIRAEVGDEIVVTLRNHTRFPVSLHPHGVVYDKADEGSGYPDGTSGADKTDDLIAPGQTYTYHWTVPERAGPGPNDPSSVVWLYHSHVNNPFDVNAGLVGVIIVTRRGAARPDGSPRDVDREFVTLFQIFDETLSLFTDDNGSVLINPGSLPRGIESGDVNRYHSINGYIFGNMPMPRMKVGERVRWYLVALGGESDLHTPHWHGNTVLADGHRTDVVELLPASMKVADMVPDDPGIWLYHCHVDDHMKSGMATLYEVSK